MQTKKKVCNYDQLVTPICNNILLLLDKLQSIEILSNKSQIEINNIYLDLIRKINISLLELNGYINNDLLLDLVYATTFSINSESYNEFKLVAYQINFVRSNIQKIKDNTLNY